MNEGNVFVSNRVEPNLGSDEVGFAFYMSFTTVDDINSARDAALTAVDTAEDAALTAIINRRTSAVAIINDEEAEAVATINAEEAAALAAITGTVSGLVGVYGDKAALAAVTVLPVVNVITLQQYDSSNPATVSRAFHAVRIVERPACRPQPLAACSCSVPVAGAGP